MLIYKRNREEAVRAGVRETGRVGETRGREEGRESQAEQAGAGLERGEGKIGNRKGAQRQRGTDGEALGMEAGVRILSPGQTNPISATREGQTGLGGAFGHSVQLSLSRGTNLLVAGGPPGVAPALLT